MEVLPRNWAGGCVACSKAFEGEYWLASGQPVCHNCARTVSEDSQELPKSLLIRLAIFALAAALLMAAISAAIQIFANYEIAFLPIAVGGLIGKTIHFLSKGLGGTHTQIIAVCATYLSLGMTVYFQFLYQLLNAGKDLHGIPGNLVLLGLAFAKPIQEAPTGIEGIMGLGSFIIALYLAWYVTRPKPIRLSGPFVIEQ